MRAVHALTILLFLAAVEPSLRTRTLLAQQPMHPPGHVMPAAADHDMLHVPLGGGWSLAGMAQAFPAVSVGAPLADADAAVRETGWYLTQPAIMANLASPGERLVLRTTLNLEGLTQPDGELTFGGWGEGFLDKRHPHTLLHELMLSLNLWNGAAGDVSLSVGRGFAPYGTDDPMARPVLKYPTNHHLSQVLERWTSNVVWRQGAWSVEAGLFGGAEPEGPYDLSGIDTFGDSWSARLTRRFGVPGPVESTWELSASYGHVTEEHEDGEAATELLNAAVRRSGPAGPGRLYALVEGSTSRPEEADGHFSVLGEAAYATGPHEPYLRVEYATRPDYAREGVTGTDDFFRYEHHAEPIGATRWLITSVGYGLHATGGASSIRPFVEVQHHRVRAERGAVAPADVLGATSFWSLSIGARVFLGGGPMRMGAYGVLDPMTGMSRAMDPGMPGMGGG